MFGCVVVLCGFGVGFGDGGVVVVKRFIIMCRGYQIGQVFGESEDEARSKIELKEFVKE